MAAETEQDEGGVALFPTGGLVEEARIVDSHVARACFRDGWSRKQALAIRRTSGMATP